MGWGWDLAVESLPNIHKTLGSISSNTQTEHDGIQLALRRQKQEGQEFKVILSLVIRLRAHLRKARTMLLRSATFALCPGL